MHKSRALCHEISSVCSSSVYRTVARTQPLDERLPTIFSALRDRAPPLGAFICSATERAICENSAPVRICADVDAYGVNIDAEGFAEERRLSSLLSRVGIACHTHTCSLAAPRGNRENLLQCQVLLEGTGRDLAGPLGVSFVPSGASPPRKTKVSSSTSSQPICLAIDPRPGSLLHLVPDKDRLGLPPQSWKSIACAVTARKQECVLLLKC